MNQLRILQLQETGLTAKGLLALKEKKDLKQLLIGGTEVTPANVEELRQALPGCLVSWWKQPVIEYAE